MDLDNCCSQCYDNAAATSGHMSGVQKLITDKKIQNLHSLTVIITALTYVVSMHLMKSLNLQPFLHILSVTGHFSRTYLYNGQL